MRELSFSQFLLFAALGGVGTAVHYLVLVAGVEAVRIEPVAGSLAGYVAGAVTNFLLAHHVAFRSAAARWRTAPRFFTVAVGGFFMNWFVMWALHEQGGAQYLIAQVAATLLVLGFNYIANALWTFSGARRGD